MGNGRRTAKNIRWNIIMVIKKLIQGEGVQFRIGYGKYSRRTEILGGYQ